MNHPYYNLEPIWLTNAYAMVDQIDYLHADQKAGAYLMLRGCQDERMANRVLHLYFNNMSSIFTTNSQQVYVQYVPVPVLVKEQSFVKEEHPVRQQMSNAQLMEIQRKKQLAIDLEIEASELPNGGRSSSEGEEPRQPIKEENPREEQPRSETLPQESHTEQSSLPEPEKSVSQVTFQSAS
jgi:hypothetical protein